MPRPVLCCRCLTAHVTAPGDACGTCVQRLMRHARTLAALLSGVAVNAALSETSREIRDTIKKEISE